MHSQIEQLTRLSTPILHKYAFADMWTMPLGPTPQIRGLNYRPFKELKFKKTKILLGTNSNEGHYFVLYYLTDIFKKQENISISREQFRKAVGELNPAVTPVGIHAINYEYTWWMDPKVKKS